MIISIQQPEYFPWLGYFDKLLSVDKVVFLDNVQFKKRYFENRNRVRTRQGWTWLTTPVISKGLYTQNIMDVRIDNTGPWQKKIAATLVHSYGGSPFWNEGGEELCELISRPRERLVDFNLAVIFFFMNKLGIAREYVLSSSLATEHSGSQLILEICRKLKAGRYLSGRDGRNYLQEKDFALNGIDIVYQDFKHPVYAQLHGGFMTNMGIADVYFNHGRGSIDIIQKAGAVNGNLFVDTLHGAEV